MVLDPLNGGSRLGSWFCSSDISYWGNWKFAWRRTAGFRPLEMLRSVWGMWLSRSLSSRTTYLRLWNVWRCRVMSGDTVSSFLLPVGRGVAGVIPSRPPLTALPFETAPQGWPLIINIYFWLLQEMVPLVPCCFSELFVTSQFFACFKIHRFHTFFNSNVFTI